MEKIEWSVYSAAHYAYMDEIVHGANVTMTIAARLGFWDEPRFALGLAFIAGIAEGKRRERARRKGGSAAWKKT